MPIIETSFEQRSEAWFKAKAGNPGASEMDNIITSEGKPSKSRMDFMYKMAAERIRGKSDESFQSQAMLDGNLKEAEARETFQFITGLEVQQVGMIYKDEKKLIHCSPDGVIGDNAVYEVKCPLGKTHAKYLAENKLPTPYFVQVQSSLYISEREYWWFMSYCDGMNPLILKVFPEKVFQRALKIELEIFCSQLSEIVEKIK